MKPQVQKLPGEPTSIPKGAKMAKGLVLSNVANLSNYLLLLAITNSSKSKISLFGKKY